MPERNVFPTTEKSRVFVINRVMYRFVDGTLDDFLLAFAFLMNSTVSLGRKFNQQCLKLLQNLYTWNKNFELTNL